jgi:3-deoxy-D-manno-octulosonate 8-phosphate phosphatase (KDO 8-P phosphatase)
MPPVIDPALARRIKVVGLDVDGVLTDGGIYLGDVGGAAHEFKRYDIQDGFGIYCMREVGLRVMVVTGRISESVRLRAAELRLDGVAQDDQARKLPALKRLLARVDVTLAETAFIGDDIPDLGILRAVALPVAVATAVAEIRTVAKVQLSRPGGFGAIREFAEMLLTARGEWNQVVERYVAEKSDADVSEVVLG